MSACDIVAGTYKVTTVDIFRPQGFFIAGDTKRRKCLYGFFSPSVLEPSVDELALASLAGAAPA